MILGDLLCRATAPIMLTILPPDKYTACADRFGANKVRSEKFTSPLPQFLSDRFGWGWNGYTGESILTLGDDPKSYTKYDSEVIDLGPFDDPWIMDHEHHHYFWLRHRKRTYAADGPEFKYWYSASPTPARVALTSTHEPATHRAVTKHTRHPRAMLKRPIAPLAPRHLDRHRTPRNGHRNLDYARVLSFDGWNHNCYGVSPRVHRLHGGMRLSLRHRLQRENVARRQAIAIHQQSLPFREPEPGLKPAVSVRALNRIRNDRARKEELPIRAFQHVANRLATSGLQVNFNLVCWLQRILLFLVRCG